MLTGTWLESEKLLAGLFFLLLVLLLLPPPVLTVLPPDTFLFRRLFGACLAGSATNTEQEKMLEVLKSVVMTVKSCYCKLDLFMGTPWLNTFKGNTAINTTGNFKTYVLPGGATIRCHFWKRQVFRQSLGLKL